MVNTYITKVQNPVHLYKRRVAEKQGFLVDVGNKEVQKIFSSFVSAGKTFNKIMKLVPVESRARGFEASSFNSCVMKELRKAFPNNCKFWKYKRFVLDINGYSILVKKLDNKGRPMNIKTSANTSIMNQMQTTLFDLKDYEKPIIFFGWLKGKQGDLINPHFVYIDDEKVKWRLYEEEIESEVSLTLSDFNASERKTAKLKDKLKKKKAN